MTYYYLLFGLFSLGAVLTVTRNNDSNRDRLIFDFSCILIALMIGFRYQVGADWYVYQEMFVYAGRASYERMLGFGDPAYQLLNWAVSQLNGKIWHVNLACGIIFSWGLLRLAQQQPYPWLAIVVAIPYLVVVVGMGYSRQAVAIGIIMAGLAALHRGGSILKFMGYVACAALFHKTAVFALPIVVLASARTNLLNLALGAAVCILFYNLFLEQSVDTFTRRYLSSGASSQGAAIRVALNLVPAVLFLARSKEFGLAARERTVWRYFSFVALLAPVALALSPSSTAVDRLGLYLLPLQVVIFSRLPRAYRAEALGTVILILYSAAILTGWLMFATHARFWIPYRIYPLA